MTTLHDRRTIALEGAFNMRDLGHVTTVEGHVVRPGKLFRADALGRLTDADLTTLAAFGIQSVVDLRLEAEITTEGLAGLTRNGTIHIHAPFMTSDPLVPPGESLPDSMADIYELVVLKNTSQIVNVIETLATPQNHPSVFHCSAGKDRTGMTTALIYSILGVDRPTIVDDYMLTDGNMARELERQRRDLPPEQRPPRSHDRAEAITMQTFLDWLDAEFGSPLQWLLTNGLQESSVTTLRHEMLA